MAIGHFLVMDTRQKESCLYEWIEVEVNVGGSRVFLGQLKYS